MSFRAWQNKIQSFQGFKNFQRFQQFEKTETTENLQNFISMANIWVDATFMGLNWLFRWKISKKFHLDRDLFSRKQ